MKIEISNEEMDKFMQDCGLDKSQITQEMVDVINAQLIQFLKDTASRFIIHLWMTARTLRPHIKGESASH